MCETSFLFYRGLFTLSTEQAAIQGLRELSVYRKFGTFTVTTEDAKEYLYSFSTRRRVYKFQDIKVNLYIWPNMNSPTTTVVGEFCVYEKAGSKNNDDSEIN